MDSNHVFPCGSASKESDCNEGDLGWIPGLGRSPGEGKGYPLQYSGLENPMDSVVHEDAKSQTGLSDFRFYFHFQSCSGIISSFKKYANAQHFKNHFLIFMNSACQESRQKSLQGDPSWKISTIG